MKQAFAILLVILLGAMFTVAVAQDQPAEKAAPAKKTDMRTVPRLSGTVHMINKDTSTITIRKGNVTREIVYTSDTKVTNQNKPATLDDVKEGSRVVAIGKWDKTKLVADRINITRPR
jgi:hypothetical protein